MAPTISLPARAILLPHAELDARETTPEVWLELIIATEELMFPYLGVMLNAKPLPDVVRQMSKTSGYVNLPSVSEKQGWPIAYAGFGEESQIVNVAYTRAEEWLTWLEPRHRLENVDVTMSSAEGLFDYLERDNTKLLGYYIVESLKGIVWRTVQTRAVQLGRLKDVDTRLDRMLAYFSHP